MFDVLPIRKLDYFSSYWNLWFIQYSVGSCGLVLIKKKKKPMSKATRTTHKKLVAAFKYLPNLGHGADVLFQIVIEDVSQEHLNTTRSSRRSCIKIDALKKFAKFKGKHLFQSLFLNKVAGLWWLLIKKRLCHMCFLWILRIF